MQWKVLDWTDTNFKINHADFNKRGIRLPWASQYGLKFLKYVFPGEVGKDPAFSGGEVKVEKHRRQRRFLPQPSTWVGFYFGSILILMLRYDWINYLWCRQRSWSVQSPYFKTWFFPLGLNLYSYDWEIVLESTFEKSAPEMVRYRLRLNMLNCWRSNISLCLLVISLLM